MKTQHQMSNALFVEYWGESCGPDERIKRWLMLADTDGSGWKPSGALFG